jgi:hypothetical protein
VRRQHTQTAATGASLLHATKGKPRGNSSSMLGGGQPTGGMTKRVSH